MSTTEKSQILINITCISNEILKPFGLIVFNPRFNISFFVQKKPDIGSLHGVKGRANIVAPQLTNLRKNVQPATFPPPTLRDPTVNSAFPLKGYVFIFEV